MISRIPELRPLSVRKLRSSGRGAVAVSASLAPWPLRDLEDMIQGQLKASDGIDFNTVVDLVNDNARRVSTGFEPLPEGFPPGATCSNHHVLGSLAHLGTSHGSRCTTAKVATALLSD